MAPLSGVGPDAISKLFVPGSARDASQEFVLCYVLSSVSLS